MTYRTASTELSKRSKETRRVRQQIEDHLRSISNQSVADPFTDVEALVRALLKNHNHLHTGNLTLLDIPGMLCLENIRKGNV